jgi:hypothetical protein
VQCHRLAGAVHLQRNRLLRVVRMLGALVDLELGCHLAAELGLGEHALDGFLEDLLGATGEQLDEALFTQAAGEAGVAAVQLLASLHAGEVDLLGIDDDDVVAHVDVGRVEGAGLAGENAGGVGRKAAERLARGVDDIPLTLDVFAAGDGGCLIQVQRILLTSAVFVTALARLEARRLLGAWVKRPDATGHDARNAESRRCG